MDKSGTRSKVLGNVDKHFFSTSGGRRFTVLLKNRAYEKYK